MIPRPRRFLLLGLTGLVGILGCDDDVDDASERIADAAQASEDLLSQTSLPSVPEGLPLSPPSGDLRLVVTSEGEAHLSTPWLYRVHEQQREQLLELVELAPLEWVPRSPGDPIVTLSRQGAREERAARLTPLVRFFDHQRANLMRRWAERTGEATEPSLDLHLEPDLPVRVLADASEAGQSFQEVGLLVRQGSAAATIPIATLPPRHARRIILVTVRPSGIEVERTSSGLGAPPQAAEARCHREADQPPREAPEIESFRDCLDEVRSERTSQVLVAAAGDTLVGDIAVLLAVSHLRLGSVRMVVFEDYVADQERHISNWRVLQAL